MDLCSTPLVYVLRLFTEEMAKRDLKTLPELYVSEIKKPVSFSNEGIDDYWGQTHGTKLKADLNNPSELQVYQPAPTADCARCNKNDCTNCNKPEVQTTMAVMKSLRTRQR